MLSAHLRSEWLSNFNKMSEDVKIQLNYLMKILNFCKLVGSKSLLLIFTTLSLQEQIINDQTAKEMAEANELIGQLQSHRGKWYLLIETLSFLYH